MKLAVVGSRSISNASIINQILDQYTFDTVVSGGAKGVDSLAEAYGVNNNMNPAIVFRPDYKTYGRSAPFVRNKLIIEAADFVVSIWDGISTGTHDSMKHANKLQIPMDVWIVTDDTFVKQLQKKVISKESGNLIEFFK